MDTNFPANIFTEEREVLSKKKFFVKGRKNVDIFEEVSTRFKSVVIKSDVNVNLKGHNSFPVMVQVNGKMPFSGEIAITISKTVDNGSSVMFIEIHLNKGSISGCSSKELTADVLIPNKLLENLSVVTDSGDVFVGESLLFIGDLSISTNTGYIESYAPFRVSFEASSESGDCDLFITARKNIAINFKTISGNFLAVLNNVGPVNLNASKTTGLIRNRHIEGLGSSADISISSVTGDIRIH